MQWGPVAIAMGRIGAGMGRKKEKRIDPAGLNEAIRRLNAGNIPIERSVRKALGISPSTWSDWRRRGIPERRIVALAQALEISPAELVAPKVVPYEADEGAEALAAMYRAMRPDDQALIWCMARAIAERDALRLERAEMERGERGIEETAIRLRERELEEAWVERVVPPTMAP